MRVARSLKIAAVILSHAGIAACTLPMGHVSAVRIQRVEWIALDKSGLQGGCCNRMEWMRVDFVSDMDYARVARRGIHGYIYYGWCPIDIDHWLGVARLLTESGALDVKTAMVPIPSDGGHPLYAYHGFFPVSVPARRYVRPGEGDGAYDLRQAKQDFCIAVAGGEMWTGRHGQSTGGVVPKAVLSNATHTGRKE